jgi:hypothetical protein
VGTRFVAERFEASRIAELLQDERAAPGRTLPAASR